MQEQGKDLKIVAYCDGCKCSHEFIVDRMSGENGDELIPYCQETGVIPDCVK